MPRGGVVARSNNRHARCIVFFKRRCHRPFKKGPRQITSEQSHRPDGLTKRYGLCLGSTTRHRRLNIVKRQTVANALCGLASSTAPPPEVLRA
eukprot:4620737-Alexandrium_andersonii.AAC.1